MHGFDEAPGREPSATATGPWHRELNRYHWFVLVVAALGWLFDTMDQQLFTLARAPAMKELLTTTAGPPDDKLVAKFGGYATSIFLIGWASGGLAFGVLGDRIGRAKVMLWTILVYSVFTGLSALSWDIWSFSVFRFLTGLGVGGEFAVGVSLVAEVMPERARPFALGLLQALSAVGNVTAALISIAFGRMEETGAVGSAWRWMFVVGTVPALLAIVIRRRLKEPERWQATAAQGGVNRSRLGSYAELFSDPRWRKHALVGLVLAFTGVVGLWGIGFFSIDLNRLVLRRSFEAQGLTGSELAGKVTLWVGITSIMLNVGAFFGIYGISYLMHYMGRRTAFAIGFVAAMLSTAMVFSSLNTLNQIFWMVPLMGFCQLALFGGYAIYFPELFPTRLRSTGTSFCYNVGRFVAAVGPYALGLLTSEVFADKAEPMRWAGVTMCAVFLLGLVALPFAPETRGQPLPE
ncbi:MAG: MFS transporter [Planctomycetaceae bacterium]